MKLRTLSLLAATLAVAGLARFSAAENAGAASAGPPAYNESRRFAQPIRETTVGTGRLGDRAFLGAPPPMPHTFAGDRDGRYCFECHARVNRVEKRHSAIAPVPHAEFSQCQQCHVSGVNKTLAPFRDTSFVGLDLPGKGTRAHAYAPPTVPHKTFMRENCLSCHGPSGKQRIASPHPWRSQCQQCHVPDAAKNYDRPLPWEKLGGNL
jgi:nitrate reductase cytochrome c-type subunit